MITEEKLMAYVDGELSENEKEAIDAALAGDQRLQARLAAERLLRIRMGELYDPALNEEIPERLTRMLQPADNRVVFLKRQSTVTDRWRWQNLAALAASLVIGMFLGQNLTGGESVDTGLEVNAQLAAALNTQLASTQSPANPVQIGISFEGPGGQPCRTFESAGWAGLACGSGGAWQLRLLAPKGDTRSAEFQQAGSASALVMGSAQELIVGEPMTAQQERQARDAGWPGK
jgi:hypothetical protein